MGNNLCSCAARQSQMSKDASTPLNIKNEMPELSKPLSAYDNDPNSSFRMEDSYLLEPSDIASDTTIETLIVPKVADKDQKKPINGNILPPVYFRSNVATSHGDLKRVTSFFSTEDLQEKDQSPGTINAEVYDIVLREMLMNYYPINDKIIREMIARNLLLPGDGETLMQQTTNSDKCLCFLNNFIFSEVNICKLATFLHVLITSKSPILLELKRSEDFFQLIVDHIYYVVNVLSLFVECFKDLDRKPGKSYLSNMVSIICLSNARRLSSIPVKPFYAKVSISNQKLPTSFTKNFSCINEHFRCCQELTLSSCDLQAQDIYHLCQGIKAAGILRDLDVSSNPIGCKGLKHIEEVFLTKNNIKSLNIACCSLTTNGVESFLETLSTNKAKVSLRQLDISHNNLMNMTERHMLLLTKLSLESLGIKAINFRHQSSLFESLKLNYSLKEIDFSGNKLRPGELTYLAAGLAYSTSVQKVSLVKMGLSKTDCGTINNTLLMNKSISSVDLSDNLIGDEGAETLKDILTMKPTLKELYLRRCGISLHGTLVLMRTVADMECNLKLLDMCHNHSPRMSFVVDIKDNVRKIQDLLHHITLVKDIRILLWGTLDEPLHFYSDCVEI